jgi:hypothetical protein
LSLPSLQIYKLPAAIHKVYNEEMIDFLRESHPDENVQQNQIKNNFAFLHRKTCTPSRQNILFVEKRKKKFIYFCDDC